MKACTLCTFSGNYIIKFIRHRRLRGLRIYLATIFQFDLFKLCAPGPRHYSNPFRPDRLITFAYHPGDVPRGIIADIVDDLGISRDDFYFKRF